MNNINDVLDQVDCFISTSDHETFSYAVAEAVMAGLPVIQTNISGTAWNINSPATMVFPKGDSNGLYRCMKSALEFTEKDLSLKVKQAAEQAKSKLSIDCWVEKVTKFFHEL